MTDLSYNLGRLLFTCLGASGGGVSCIATEAEFGTLAVADNDGRLLVYVQHRRNCEAREPDES